MTSETGAVATSGQELVVLAGFDSYRHAEDMVSSLGREFRRKARKGGQQPDVSFRPACGRLRRGR